MLADPDVDVVTIGTPSGAHMEPAVAAARAGKHVIVEKPLEITLKRCDKIIDECEKAGVVLSTIYPSRFHNSSVEMKKAIDQGRFGQLTAGDAYVKWYRTQAYYDSGAWRGTWELDGGGALMNQAIHSVDLLSWLMGPVAEIRGQIALLAHKRIAVEDHAVATLKFENGALGGDRGQHGHISRLSEADRNPWLNRLGHDGRRRYRQIGTLPRLAPAIRPSTRKWPAGGSVVGVERLTRRPIGHHGHTHQFQDVVKAIQKKTKPAIDGYEGRRSVEIILAIYKAAETGKAVSLPLKSDPVLKARKTGVGG